MWNSFHSCITKARSDTVKADGGTKAATFIYRDELSKKPQSVSKPKTKQVSWEDKKSLQKQSYSGFEQKEVIRVKVKMTKHEAARLLSRCKDGGVLEFRDVAHELVQIPVNRVCVETSAPRRSHDAVLMTIPEES